MPFYNIKRKLLLPKEESEEFTFREIEDGIYFQAVSYTHLDVYKRQFEDWPPWWKSFHSD